MKCPKCSYEPTMAEQTASPDTCPSCGVVYAKVLARQTPAAQGAAQPKPSRTGHQTASQVREGRVVEVVLTSVRIPFLSLIWLMTKIILAALPAAILAGLILVMLGSFVGGVFSGFSKYSSDDVASISSSALDSPDDLELSSSETQSERPDRREIAEQCRRYEEFAETLMQGRQAGVPMSTALGTTDNELLNHLVVSAYEKPRYGTENMQQREVEDFRNEVYLECIKNMR